MSGAGRGRAAPPPPPRPGRAVTPGLAAEFDALQQEQDADCRRFYRSYAEDVAVLSRYVTAR